MSPDGLDKRAAGAGLPITNWTLDTAANFTGHFNTPLKTTELAVAAGSQVWIRDTHNQVKVYQITALTSDGDAADNVTLDAAAPTGLVEKLLSGFTHRLALIGETAAAGFTLAADASVNEDGKIIMFEAGLYE